MINDLKIAKKSTGYTILELLMTLTVAGILLAVATPSLQEAIQKNRTTSGSNELVGSFSVARSESVKRGSRVVVCKSADLSNCETNATGYEQGWIVFVDTNNDAVRDAGEEILRVHEAVDGNVTITGAGNVANYISYMPEGRALLAGSTNSQTGTIIVDACPEAKRKLLQLTFAGRVKTSKGSCP